jgi:hypothetical protein
MELLLCNVTLGANETTNHDQILINRGGDTKINAVTLVGKCVRAGGGGECDAYIQTNIDGTWYDIADFHFTTDATLTKFFNLTTATAVTAAAGTLPASPIADDTAVDTVLGDSLRVRLITSGTAYTGASTLKVVAIVR